MIKAVQGSSETTLVTLALHCASYSQTGAAGIGTVTSVLRVLTQTHKAVNMRRYVCMPGKLCSYTALMPQKSRDVCSR